MSSSSEPRARDGIREALAATPLFGGPVGAPLSSPLADVLVLDEHRAPPLDLVGRYDAAALRARIDLVARHAFVRGRELGAVGGWPLSVLRLPSSVTPALRVVVTAGVHGVEPAGPAAVLLFLAQALRQRAHYADVDLTLVPIVNPVGYEQRIRGNAEHVDLNRRFGPGADVPREVALVREVLDGARFDLGIDLHSSRSSGQRGFFALHRSATDLLTPAMRRFGERYPLLDESTDRYVRDGAGVLRSANAGTIKDYLCERGTRWAVTIEAPAAMPYEVQVRGSADVVHTLVETARALR